MEPFQELELRWAEFNGVSPEGMVACSSGTSAIHLALEALQLPQGSEVVMSDFTMIACPRACTLAGLTPVFVDCDDRLLIDSKLISDACDYDELEWLDKVPPNVQAVLITHIYGRQFQFSNDWDMPGIYQIEDLAEAHGVRPHKETDAACWSYYRNKIVAGEEGGAVWFRNPQHASLARQLRSLGFTDKHDFQHIPRGHNYRMSNTHAKLILQSLNDCAFNRYRRRQIEMKYEQVCPKEWRMPYRDAVWVYDIRIPGMTHEVQDKIVAALNTAGIAARHAFKPMSSQQEYRECRAIGQNNAYKAAREVIYLPVHPAGTLYQDEERAEKSFAIIKNVLGSY